MFAWGRTGRHEQEARLLSAWAPVKPSARRNESGTRPEPAIPLPSAYGYGESPSSLRENPQEGTSCSVSPVPQDDCVKAVTLSFDPTFLVNRPPCSSTSPSSTSAHIGGRREEGLRVLGDGGSSRPYERGSSEFISQSFYELCELNPVSFIPPSRGRW